MLPPSAARPTMPVARIRLATHADASLNKGFINRVLSVVAAIIARATKPRNRSVYGRLGTVLSRIYRVRLKPDTTPTPKKPDTTSYTKNALEPAVIVAANDRDRPGSGEDSWHCPARPESLRVAMV